MRKKIRVIVRPWSPRIIPYTIPADRARTILQEAYPKLKKVLYIGWAKRHIDGKRVLQYLAATGDNTLDARRVFKQGTDYGKNIWNLGQ